MEMRQRRHDTDYPATVTRVKESEFERVALPPSMRSHIASSLSTARVLAAVAVCALLGSPDVFQPLNVRAAAVPLR